MDIGADWVESGRAGENPQPEGKEKQAGWVESGGAGESPQPVAKKKQAGWVENGRAGENPQSEVAEKQAGWVENGRAGENPQPEAMRSKQVGYSICKAIPVALSTSPFGTVTAIPFPFLSSKWPFLSKDPSGKISR